MAEITCKYCGARFNETLRRCPECGVRVRDSAPKYKKDLHLKLAATACTQPEADMICSILEAENIPFVLEYPDGGPSPALFVEMVSRTEIYVSEEDFEKASSLLSELQQSEISEEELAELALQAENPEEEE